MMKKIEVGMFVKHHLGIFQITYIDNKILHAKRNWKSITISLTKPKHENTIETATHNLIELIQRGDVIEVADGKLEVWQVLSDGRIDCGDCVVDLGSVQSVMTKEQYEANCFHVKEENT